MPPVKIDPWVESILVDPMGKIPLIINREENVLSSPYGRTYPIINGIFNLRLLRNELTHDQKLWKEGQIAYEEWDAGLIARDADRDYNAEREGVSGVYQDIPIKGRCLDVGGHQGRLRAFLDKDQEYISVDPFHNVFNKIDQQPNLLATYPFLKEPVNFLCCDAEFLPFKHESLMSCI